MQIDERRQRMFALVEQWQSSKISQKQFSEDHHMKLPTFSYWVKKHREHQAGSPGFAKVEIGQHRQSLSSARLEIELTDGCIVRIF